MQFGRVYEPFVLLVPGSGNAPFLNGFDEGWLAPPDSFRCFCKAIHWVWFLSFTVISFTVIGSLTVYLFLSRRRNEKGGTKAPPIFQIAHYGFT